MSDAFRPAAFNISVTLAPLRSIILKDELTFVRYTLALSSVAPSYAFPSKLQRRLCSTTFDSRGSSTMSQLPLPLS